MNPTIDLNADLGEGFGIWQLGDDEALLEVVTSANVACGFHAGDPAIMQRVCSLARERGVAVGAQVGYRDLAGFGRRAMDVPPAELASDLLYQIGALSAFGEVRYLKPHGALYNRVVHDERQAMAVIEAARAYRDDLPVICLPDSALLRAARAAGLFAIEEGFADRAYTADGHLVPRDQPGALNTDESAVVAHALKLAHRGVRTLCVHGDTPGAVRLAQRVRAALEADGFKLAPFA